jgi:hypothetical protein
MKKAGKAARHMWTEDEKAKLIAEFEALPEGETIRAFLKKHKINSGWFYMTRKKYFSEHPTVKMERPTAPAPASSFAQLPVEEKRRLIAEYGVLPYAEKAAWRERYGLTTQMTTYWRGRLKKIAPPTGKPLPNGSREAEAALVAEYGAIPTLGGGKGVWLKAHNLNHQTMHSMRLRVLARAASNGHSHPLEQLPALPSPEAPPVTLDDAILSFEVQRDQLNTFIEQLKRMRSGR